MSSLALNLRKSIIFVVFATFLSPLIAVTAPSLTEKANAAVTFSQTFNNGGNTTAAQSTAWNTFAASLTGTYGKFTMSSEYGSVTVTHGTYVNTIASCIKNYPTACSGSPFTISTGVIVTIGGCGGGVEVTVGPASSMCQCPSTGYYTIRAQIGNSNWGGMNSATCGGATQTITVSFGDATNTVSFDANSGSGSPSVSSVTQASVGAAVNLASVGSLARTGFTFSGWNTAANGSGTTYSAGSSYTPNASVTLYAQWNSTITYDANSATSGSSPSATTAKSSAAVTTLATNTGSLAKTGYTFGGWNTAANGSGSSYLAGLTTYSSPGNTTLYAQWNSVITYLSNGSTSGSVPGTSSLYGTSGTLAANSGSLAKTGFTPGGWNTNETGTGTSYGFSGAYTPSGNRNLYAQWNSVVTYNGNSNTGGAVPANTTISGTSGTLATNSGSLTNTGKVFAGWNTNSTGTGIRYAAGATYPNSGNITLYAQWVNPLAISGASSISVGQGTAYRSDTYTATYGLDTKTVTYALTPSNSGITLETSTITGTTYAYIRVAATVVAGTFTDTLTATDQMGTSVTLPVTITISSPIRWDSTTATSLTTTSGKSASLQLKTVNGFSNKTFVMVAGSAAKSSGITLDTTTASSGYATLNIATSVFAGTYVESITASDASGTKITLIVTVNVNGPVTIVKSGVTVAAPYSSLSFNGSNQYVTYGPTDKFQVGSTYTLEWWQYQTDASSYPRIISMYSLNFGVSLESDTFYLWNGGSNNMGSLGTTRKNAWTHFAVVSNAGNVMVYQNGVALKSTATSVTTIGATQAPSNVNICIASQCGSANTFFGGQITNLILSKRADYSGSNTASANFTLPTTMNVDANTVFAITSVNNAATFTDFSANAFIPTSYNGTPTGSSNYPGGSSVITTELVTTQGFAATTSAYTSTGGSGDKTFTMTSNNAGISLNASTSAATVTLGSSVTATNSTTAKVVYETITATDAVASTISAPIKFTINPPISLAATTLSPSTAAQIAAYDTITASYGTGTKSFSYVGSPISSAITFTSTAANTLLMTVGKTAVAGTYYETITATDTVGDTETVVLTITVNPGLSLVSNTGTNALTSTAGTLSTLRVNAQNGSGTKTFTLTHMGTSNAGITLDNTNAASGYTLLTIGTAVPVGTYSESITVTDSQGSTSQILISVTVNPAPTLSYGGATSGAIALATTAGTSLRSSLFTAASGTGTRTITLSGLNSGISIDTSTADLAYVTLGSSLTATNSTTARTIYETVTVTDGLGARVNRAITITINPAIALSASSTSVTTTAGIATTDTVTVTSTTGTGTKTFSLSPAIGGVSFTNAVANQAVISIGTSVGAGTYSLTVTAQDSVGATSQIVLTINVNPGPTISGASSGAMTAGYIYRSPNYSIANGTGAVALSLAGTLSNSIISIETSTALVFRYKVLGTVTAGTYYETLTATDSLGAVGTFTFTLIVNPVVTLSGDISTSTTFGVSKNVVLQISGGTAPYTVFGSTICAPYVTTSGSYTIATFMGTGTCNWKVPSGLTTATALVVAGGGGGDRGVCVVTWGHGGGGGEVLEQDVSLSPGASVSVTVGTGGSAGGACGSNIRGGTGGNSSFASLTSRGGVSAATLSATTGGFSGNGNTGGSPSGTGYPAGGGGGAGGAGSNLNGGIGVVSTITGLMYGAGGAGKYDTSFGTSYGLNGVATTANGSLPPENSGKGGSDSAAYTLGVAGASGVVVIKYLTPDTQDNTYITAQVDTYTVTGKIILNIPDSITVGTYTEALTIKDSAGASFGPWTVTMAVNKATPSLSFAIPGGGSSVTYGTPVLLTGTASTTGTFNFKIGTTSITSCGSKPTTSGIATCSWTPTIPGSTTVTADFSPSDLIDFNVPSSANLALTVNKADTITVTFVNQELTYTGSTLVVNQSYTISGLVNSDSITAISKKFVGAANGASAGSYNSVTAPTNAGLYTLNAETTTSFVSLTSSGGNVSATNYLGVIFVGGTITVNRASNAIAFNYGINNAVTYSPSGTETATITSFGDGIKSFTTVSASQCSVDGSSGVMTKLAAGICSITMSVTQGTNHLANTITAPVTINKAPRTIALSRSATTLKYSETSTVSYAISAETSTGLISYTISDGTKCSFNESTLILTAISGSSSCTLNASITEGTNYLASNSAGVVFNLNLADAPIVTTVPPADNDYLQSSGNPSIQVTGLKLSDTTTATSATFTYVASGTYPYSSTTKPTNANSYSITPSALILTSGSLANYQTPQYVPANWSINRIAQSPVKVLTTLQDSITVPIDITVSGGTTAGLLSITILGGGTASGCSAVNMNLRANSTGTCIFTVNMAGNQNYLPVTSDTATLIIANYVQTYFNFDAVVSGGGGISISSEVPLVKGPECSTLCIPTISSVSPTTFQSGDLIVITGVDFANATAVIFNRSVTVTTFQIDSNTQITVQVPTGLTSPGVSAPASISIQSPGKLSFRFSGLTVTG